MERRFLPFGHHAAMDSFYKRPDGSVTPMAGREFKDI
jgi:hypothetical protein